MAQTQFALKNGDQIVRIINFETSPRLYALVTVDQRIEFATTLTQAKQDFEGCTILTDFTKAQVKKGPVVIKDGLTVEQIEDQPTTIKSTPFIVDEVRTYKDTLKWSSVGHVVALVLILLLGFFLKPDAPEEVKVVQVIKQNRIVKKTPPPKVKTAKVRKSYFKKNRKARVSNKNKKGKRIVNRRAKKTYKAKRVKNVAKKSFTRGRVRKNSGVRNVSKMGALGALGGPSSGRTGANLKAAGVSGGRGAARFKGNGVNQKALFGKGLVQVSQGNGVKVGRYKSGSGTRGVGGGGSAKYGKGNIHSGGGAGYVVPMYEEALVHGGLSREQIEAVIKRNEGQVRYCYEKGLQVSPNLSGTVAVHFVINGRGRVSSANVKSSSLRSSKVKNCIVAKLKRWQFPRPVGGLNVKVNYPFKFMRANQMRLSSMD